MSAYSLTAVVDGFDLDSEFQNAGLECLDYAVVLSKTSGVTYADAEIEAPSPVDAVLRFHADLRSINASIRRIDLDLVTITDIAERINKTRETVRLWATGARRQGFPNHFGQAGESLVWAWADVHSWLRDVGIVDSEEAEPLPVEVIEGMNGGFAQVRSRWTDGWLRPARPSATSPRVAAFPKMVAEPKKRAWVAYSEVA